MPLESKRVDHFDGSVQRGSWKPTRARGKRKLECKPFNLKRKAEKASSQISVRRRKGGGDFPPPNGGRTGRTE